jgi:hypothetical protein
MILKGSQRANGADLAIHLMNKFDNESVEIAEVYGTVAGDLYGAFAEFEAVAAGTKASKYLYSLSINPSAPLTREQYHEAIQSIENRLGLTGQPRAVVFHVKRDKSGEGREHCHVVWSRIDIENLRAIHMAHDHRKLMDLACELAQKYGLDLPPGLKAWEQKQKHEKDKLEPTLAEKAQEGQTGISAEERAKEVTACYEQSDTAEAFVRALEQKGYVLARGDRRGLVVVDAFGNPHSLSRYVKNHKGKDIKAKLASLKAEALPSVDQAKAIQKQRLQAQQDQKRERAQEDAAAAQQRAQQALAAKHAGRRTTLLQKEQQLLTRQQAEKLMLHAAQETEKAGLLYRVRRAVADLINRTPALRSVLGHIQKLTNLDPRQRHALEGEALSRRHEREKLEIERERRVLSRLESREIRSLEKALHRAKHLARDLDDKARQEFAAVAGYTVVQGRGGGGEELTLAFNDASGYSANPGPRSGGNDEGGRTPGWKKRAEDLRRGHRPRRGKGYGYRRDDP